MAFTIETIRPGVQFTPRAARSFRRLEADLGRPVDVNSTYRDRDTQMGMFRAWQAWVNGTGPKPPHSRAVHPDYSIHCQGEALDSDDWTTPGFITLAAEHGWIRTAASDPTERHHLEYQVWRDQHINDPAPAGTTGDDDMPYTPAQLTDIIRNAITGLHGNDGGRNILDSQKQTRDDIAALAREFSDVGGKVWNQTLAVPAELANVPGYEGRERMPAKEFTRYAPVHHRDLALRENATRDAIDARLDELEGRMSSAADHASILSDKLDKILDALHTPAKERPAE